MVIERPFLRVGRPYQRVDRPPRKAGSGREALPKVEEWS